MKKIILLIISIICFQAYDSNTVLGQGCPQPTVGFQYTTNGLSVTFIDSSIVTGQATYNWNFGDGSTSSSQNPTYTFNSPGTYWVCLFIQDSCAHNTYCDSITVTAPCAPTAAFIPFVFSQGNVDFYDVSSYSGSATFSWDFGDGSGTSSVQHPSYVYNLPGNYQVCLTVTDVCGLDTYCENINVNVSSPCPQPIVNFQYNQTQGTLTFFNGSTTTGAATYSWNFGDGSTSSAQNPTYTYANPGFYMVCLLVTDSCGHNSYCDSIAITAPCQGPTADFVTTTFLPGHIDFNSLSSTSGATSYSWDFGDGLGTSTAENPSYTYTTTGVFQVCLTVTDQCGTDTYCEGTVVCIPANVDFQYNVTQTTVVFDEISNLSTLNQPTYSWDFGDGTGTSNLADPSYTYATDGVYQVCLTIWDATMNCPGSTSCQTIVVGCPAPSGWFYSYPNGWTYNFSGYGGVVVDSGITFPNTTYSWDFGDGIGTSTAQDPNYTFTAAGDYVVCLTVTNPCGTGVFCDTITITGPCAPPTAGFQFSENQGTVSFAGSSSTSGPTTYSWDFGDGVGSSTAQNPTYTYGSPGAYWVTLTVTDSCGSDDYSTLVQASCVNNPVAGFQHSANELIISFTDNSIYSGTPIMSWDFGDGATATGFSITNATHNYNTAGEYTICLTITDDCGTNTYCEDIIIGCPRPIASFNYTTNQLTVSFYDSSNTFTSATYYWEISSDSNMTDPITSTLQNPTILLDSAGTYWVCLYVSDSCGGDWFCDSIVVPKLNMVSSEELNINRTYKLASIYPNPAKNNLSIKFNELQTNSEIQIVDVIGKLMRKYNIEYINNINLDISSLKNGVYFVHIKSNNKILTEKVIINN